MSLVVTVKSRAGTSRCARFITPIHTIAVIVVDGGRRDGERTIKTCKVPGSDGTVSFGYYRLHSQLYLYGAGIGDVRDGFRPRMSDGIKGLVSAKAQRASSMGGARSDIDIVEMVENAWEAKLECSLARVPEIT